MKNYSYEDSRFKRFAESGNRYEIIRDIHRNIDAEICYSKFEKSKTEAGLSLVPIQTIDIKECTTTAEIGTVVHGIENQIPITVWLPCEPKKYTFDTFGRLEDKKNAQLHTDWDIHSRICLSVSGNLRDGDSIFLPFIKFTDPSEKYFREISKLSERELRPYKRSEWFFASSAKTLWNYLIHGSLYDPRESKTNGRRFKCQQCALAWWKYLQRNYSETGKEIYILLRNEVAYSILLDMENDGGWRHGFWSDAMETHSRFHLDGLELFISQYDETNDKHWLTAAQGGMAFVLNNLVDVLDDGSLWFLHDTMENKRNHHFLSKVFGKDPYNSLCLNTHIHALRVLHQIHQRCPEDKIYIEKYKKGMHALKRVLEHQPADLIYKPLIQWVFNEKINSDKKSYINRISKIVDYRVKKPLYWYVRKCFPRLVHPNGFIERDLSLSYASDRYHITNIKELLKLYEPERMAWLKPYIVNGVRFIKEYISQKGVGDVLKDSPYFIEIVDILILYSRYIEKLPDEYIENIQEEIRKESGGYSVEFQLDKMDKVPVVN